MEIQQMPSIKCLCRMRTKSPSVNKGKCRKSADGVLAGILDLLICNPGLHYCDFGQSPLLHFNIIHIRGNRSFNHLLCLSSLFHPSKHLPLFVDGLQIVGNNRFETPTESLLHPTRIPTWPRPSRPRCPLANTSLCRPSLALHT